MKTIYLYPYSARNRTGIRNPYMSHLRYALGHNFQIANTGKPSNRGIFDILKYIRKIDVVFLNWIEDLPGKHLGILQSIFFLLMIRVFRLYHIKIVWIMHNKKSHYSGHTAFKRLLFNQMLTKSDLVITHAKEGLDLVPDRTRSAYIPHPVRTIASPDVSGESQQYDLIFWGSITPYKGIDRFIEFLNDKGVLEKFRILVAGKITTSAIREKFQKYLELSQKITLKDEFVPEPELMALIKRSKLVVITYQSESVLSSGVLMDSLSQRVPIIGPHTGSFKDLAELGLIETFRDYSELLEKIEILLGDEVDQDVVKKTDRFIEENTWERFSDQLKSQIEQLF